MELEPTPSRHIRLSEYPSDHVRFAYAVIAAYAVIEQLGLEVRASASRPSFVNGAWNPPVRADLEARLVSAGVDLHNHEVWHLRGPKTRIERARALTLLKRAQWAYGPVRDIEVDVVDAIAGVSWLRSRAAAHKLGDLGRSLSVYDVANAQLLSRRLLLEALGLFRVY